MVCLTANSTSSPIKSAGASGPIGVIATERHALVDFRRAGIPLREHQEAWLIIGSRMRLTTKPPALDNYRRFAPRAQQLRGCFGVSSLGPSWLIAYISSGTNSSGSSIASGVLMGSLRGGRVQLALPDAARAVSTRLPCQG